MQTVQHLGGDIMRFEAEAEEWRRHPDGLDVSTLGRVRFPNGRITIGYRSGKYRRVGHNRRARLVHDLVLEAWYPQHAEIYDRVDHIDDQLDDAGCKLNRLCDLRWSNTHLNGLNQQKPRKKSNSGILGVSWHKQHKKWYAQIGVEGTNVCLGCYTSKEEAGEVVKRARAAAFEVLEY